MRKKRTPRLRFNDPALTKAFDVLAEHIDSIPEAQKVRAGSNILINETPNEVIINGTPSGSSAVSTHSCSCPMDVTLLPADPDDVDNKDKKIEVSAGSVNGMLISGREGANDSLTETDEGYLVISIEMGTTGGVTKAEVTWTTNEPEPIGITEDEPPSSFDIPLAYINEHKVQRVLGCFNIVVFPRVTCVKADSSGSLAYNYTISVYPA